MNEQILKRLRKDRPMASISIRMPEDVIDDLKALAPLLGFSGYQPLIRAYIGQGLRKDLARLQDDPLKRMAQSLRRLGVNDGIIAESIRVAQGRAGEEEGFLDRACEQGQDYGSDPETGP